MELSIIILNYKMKGLVKNCIKSVFESELNIPFEIIVVDNNSNDSIEEMLKEKFPEVKLIKSEKNLGMGAGNNLGIKEAKGKYILILNPDIFVFTDSIKKIIEKIKADKKIGLVSPKLLNPDKTLQYTCYRWHNLSTPIFRRTPLGNFSFAQKELDRFLMADWTHDEEKEVDWIQGSCLLIPKDVIDQVGAFDDRFFMYFEDTDLCRRISQAGYKIVYYPESEVIHLHRRQSADGNVLSSLFNKMTRVHITSWLKYLWKWRRA